MPYFPGPLPLTLYIHIPWCVRKCPYCDFNSHAVRGELPEQNYIDALIKDLQADLPRIANPDFESIFIGGGTPSLFSGKSIDRLLKLINERVNIKNNAEVTLEANPGTVEYARFAEYRQAGINRLSIGVQSMQAHQLKNLGRIHSPVEVINAVKSAKKAGFTRINLDLMYGLPEQSLQDALDDLEQALALQPAHLSWYQLTLEPNTLFYQYPPKVPNHDLVADIELAGRNLLLSKDFVQYEISAYCLPNELCKHNLNYWQFGDYLGIGAGAHSKITDYKTHAVTRFWKYKHPKDYLNLDKKFIAEINTVTAQELPFEFMMNALRLKQPITVKLFTERTGLPLTTITPILNRAHDRGLLVFNEELIQLTELGNCFVNEILNLFMEK